MDKGTQNISRTKLIVFSLLPLLIFMMAAEVTVRLIGGLASPQIRTLPLPGESTGLSDPDPELFWSMRPNISVMDRGVEVRTNSLGLRSPEVGPKAEGETRVLSLGESTTFGAGVRQEDNYSARLEVLLNAGGKVRHTVVNAGVNAYSSFQSLVYLKKRGLRLKPDIIVFYHEVNDYLPTSLRGSGNNEIGATMTDRQMYESKKNTLDRILMDRSAFYRFLKLSYARYRIRRFDTAKVKSPLVKLGMPDASLPPRLASMESGEFAPARINERALKTRVSEPERLKVFEELHALSLREGIELIVVHPSYRYSKRHECLLTRFCKENNVRMVEAYDVLHPWLGAELSLFRDVWHPTSLGHQRLAEVIGREILRHKPPAEPDAG